MKKDLTKISDLNKEEILKIIELAFKYKNGYSPKSPLKNKVVAMVFEKPSLRTKIAFEVATAKLGGIPVYLSSEQIFASGNNEKGRESIPDIAKNLERFTDLILARVYDHSTIQKISKNTQIPLINALCNKHHPTQALADLMTIIWYKWKHQLPWPPHLESLKVAFIGDGNNVATSLMEICKIIGIHFAIASPKEYEIPHKNQQSNIEFLNDPQKAAKNADIIYTDTFVSMGEENLKKQKLKAFKEYQVNSKLLNLAKPDAVFMHCLPAHRGEEVSNEVMDCKQSVIFDQAQCRLHIAKSLLTIYLK